MVVEQEMKIFIISYLWDIQNTSGITLNRNYIRNADINELGSIGRPTGMIDKTFNSDKEIK